MNEAKVQESSLECVKTRIATFALALVVAFSMAMTTPVSAFAAPVIGNGVTIDKTATPLNEDDQTTVTLSVGGEQTKDKAVVMFILDKSTSNDVRQAAADMLDELAQKTNTDLLYNVVVFSGTATSTGWQNIQDKDTYDDILNDLKNSTTTSGTNMDAGIECASSQMADLPAEYKDADSYLVTLSDGITYVWSEDGNVKTVPVKQQSDLNDPNPGETTIQDSASSWDASYGLLAKNGTYKDNSISAIYGSFSSFLSSVPTKITATDEAGYVKDYGAAYAEPYLTTAIYNAEDTKNVMEQFACGPEIAMYQSAVGYASLAGSFDHSYAYAVPETDNSDSWSLYPWGKELMEYCKSISTNANDDVVVSNEDAEAMFEPIKDELLYAIHNGAVTDVIGNNFDLVGLDTFKLSVGGKTYPGTVSEEAGTVTFDDGNYVINYSNGSESEQFTWKINTPVVNGSDLKLTYDLKLVNKQTAAGNYTVPTNESAVLNYTSTDLGSGDLEFPVPTVTYTVEEAPVSPATPDNGNNNNNVNTGTVNVNTDSDGKATSLPKTSDNVLPFAAGLIALIALAGSAGAVAWRKTH